MLGFMGQPHCLMHKFEIRIPPDFIKWVETNSNTKGPKILNAVLSIWIYDFEFVSKFEFRASIFIVLFNL